jgi:hypothetical protein
MNDYSLNPKKSQFAKNIVPSKIVRDDKNQDFDENQSEKQIIRLKKP